MKTALVLIAACALFTGCAGKPGDVTITVPAARVAQCEQQGGCSFVSHDELYAKLTQVFTEAYGLGGKHQAEQCGRKS
ncbi:MAG: hypothetical protein ACREUF_04365 [Solimonas sp.]